MNKNYTLNQLPEIAHELIKKGNGKILLFYGAMGAGKTMLIKELVKQLDSDDVVASPTFSLVNEYQTQNGELIYHFDFYRIKIEEEAMDMGVEEYFSSGNRCLVEWPDKIKNLLPLDAIEISLSINKDGSRNISVKSNNLH